MYTEKGRAHSIVSSSQSRAGFRLLAECFGRTAPRSVASRLVSSRLVRKNILSAGISNRFSASLDFSTKPEHEHTWYCALQWELLNTSIKRRFISFFISPTTFSYWVKNVFFNWELFVELVKRITGIYSYNKISLTPMFIDLESITFS